MCFHCNGRENIRPQWNCDWLEIGKYNHKCRKSSGILMHLLKNYRKKTPQCDTKKHVTLFREQLGIILQNL